MGGYFNKTQLSVFEDNTAIYIVTYNMLDSSWSEKSNDLIVLKCKYPSSQNEHIMTLSTEGSQKNGYLLNPWGVGKSKTTVMLRASSSEGILSTVINKINNYITFFYEENKKPR